MSRKRRTEDMLFEPASKRHDPSDDSPIPLSSHEDAPSARTCLVCDETKPNYIGFPEIPHVSEHGHGNDICYECYRLHLDAEVDNKMWDQVSCPQCPLLLKKIEIWVLATVETMIEHKRFTDRAAASSNPDYRYCLSTSCDAGQVHDGGLVFTCQTCNHKHCTACEVNWHDDETCEEYQARHQTQKQEEEDSKKAMRILTKYCPRCDSPIEKSEGCDHMTCSRCSWQFCWSCLADFRPIARQGLHRHEESCPDHRPEGDPGHHGGNDGVIEFLIARFFDGDVELANAAIRRSFGQWREPTG